MEFILGPYGEEIHKVRKQLRPGSGLNQQIRVGSKLFKSIELVLLTVTT